MSEDEKLSLMQTVLGQMAPRKVLIAFLRASGGNVEQALNFVWRYSVCYQRRVEAATGTRY